MPTMHRYGRFATQKFPVMLDWHHSTIAPSAIRNISRVKLLPRLSELTQRFPLPSGNDVESRRRQPGWFMPQSWGSVAIQAMWSKMHRVFSMLQDGFRCHPLRLLWLNRSTVGLMRTAALSRPITNYAATSAVCVVKNNELKNYSYAHLTTNPSLETLYC